MEPDRAELSSMATQLSELVTRVADTGELLNQGDTDDVAASLFEVERALRTASRSLQRALDQLSRASGHRG